MELTEAQMLAYGVVDALKPRADKWIGDAPMWYGWALREAYEMGSAAGMERAAKICEARTSFDLPVKHDSAYTAMAIGCAAAIRAAATSAPLSQ